MTKYRAIIVLPAGASEGRFEFDAPEGFMQNAPSRIVDTFLSTVSGLDLPSDPVESEINSAHNFRDTQTVTASGSFIMRTGTAVPFVAMISPARD
ncbi:MAG: hypothetical protein O9333_04640 [Beijerinckiaceae bacterium]|jgi:hypothetical protein|nr:hypothetical protein [Beijerinckiaceae bacterium]